jgi:peptide-methionine (S)-S-oxide reductase
MEKELKKATFAAGCFWHMQNVFDKIPGVVSSVVGYAGGQGIPEYKTAERMGFAEAIEIVFDPQKVGYGDLLEIFWKTHDPTSLDRQGADVGRRYRSAVFYHDQEQKEEAEKSKQEKQKEFAKPIVTEIAAVGQFFPAEEEHQKYFEKNHKNTC